MSQTGIIFDVKRFAVHDGPGIRTTVFLKGCPLACEWCHNPESRQPGPEILPMNGYHRCARWLRTENPHIVGKEVTADECLQEIEKDTVFYDQSGGGVTFSGGEPLVQPAFMQTLLRGCRDRGIHTAIDTSGHAPWSVIEPLLNTTDLFLFDIKLTDDAEHRSRTGVGTKQIHDNLMRLHDSGANVEVRIPLIPDITDTDANLTAIADMIQGLDEIRSVHLLPFNTIATDKYRRLGKTFTPGSLKKQSQERLSEMASLFSDYDLNVKIGG